MTAGGTATPTSLALRLGGMTTAEMQASSVLPELCRALPRAVGAAGAVILLTTSPETVVYSSDDDAAWLGELQRRSGSGPLPNALRSGKNMVTPDLTRVGPPDLAAAAAEIGVLTSVAVPLLDNGHRLGGLQLVGDSERPVGAELAEVLRPLIEALRARLIDMRAMWQLACAAQPAAPHASPADGATPPSEWSDVAATQGAPVAIPGQRPPAAQPVPPPEAAQPDEPTEAITTVAPAPAEVPSPPEVLPPARHRRQEATPDDDGDVDPAAAELPVDAEAHSSSSWFGPVQSSER